MSVSSTTRKQQFVLDGATADYTFNFRALLSAPEDIKCSVTTGGTTTVLTYTTQYSVSVNADGAGGTVTLVSASTIGLGTLTVYRETTNLQSSDYDDYNQFPANTLENDLDIRTMVDQEQSETFERSVKLPIESTLTGIELPSPEAGKTLKWNATADNLENSDYNVDNLVTEAIAALTVAVVTYSNTAVTASTAALVSQNAAAASAVSSATYASTALAASSSAESYSTTALTHSNTALTYAQIAQTASTTALSANTITINLQTNNYTLALTDVNKLIDLNSTGTITLTIPSSGAVNLATGSVIAIRQLGTGQVVITTSATVTLNRETGLKTTGQYATASLIKTGTDTWLALGALEA